MWLLCPNCALTQLEVQSLVQITFSKEREKKVNPKFSLTVKEVSTIIQE